MYMQCPYLPRVLAVSPDIPIFGGETLLTTCGTHGHSPKPIPYFVTSNGAFNRSGQRDITIDPAFEDTPQANQPPASASVRIFFSDASNSSFRRLFSKNPVAPSRWHSNTVSRSFCDVTMITFASGSDSMI